MELTLQSTKILLGQKFGYLTAVLYLSAHNSSSIMNLCSYASPECSYTCLGHTAGRLRMKNAQKAQIRRTKLLHDNRAEFLTTIQKDIEAVIRKAKREGLKPCFRMNGTSDLPWLDQYFANMYPDIQYYSYTKIPRPWERQLKNYDITFSFSENNYNDCIEALEHGINVTVVFNTKKKDKLPSTWHGFEVIDGDETDLRFLDKKGKTGIIIGLHAKGLARKLKPGGFVQIGDVK